MYTRCPECSTCFRVTERHLAIAKGKVRCGKCQLVFNAPDNAIDDLPVSQLASQTTNSTTATTPTKAVEVNQTTPAASKTENKENKTAAQKAPVTKQAEPKQEAAAFNADATMIADINQLNENELEHIDLDFASGQNDDDIFNNNIDLNAAIDELTKSTENINQDNPFLATTLLKKDNQQQEEKKTDKAPEQEKNVSTPTQVDNIFDSGSYSVNSAGSVADILNEMEGQLSLDIDEPEPEEEKEYDVNSEFDFIKLDEDESPVIPVTEKDEAETFEDEFEIIGPEENEESIDEEIESEDINETSDKNSNDESKVDAEALFDQVDLSDFTDSKIDESIVLENTTVAGFNEENIGKHADDYEIPLQLRDDLANLDGPSRRLFSPLFAYPFIVLLLLLSFSQLSYFRAYELVNVAPALRPFLEKFCETVACHYSGPQDIDQVQLLSRDVRRHPKEKKALLISAAMINNANFAQPYPDIHIRLSDISGNVVAERIFNAKTYMGKISNPFLLMKSKTPVHINFEVVDPGTDAINFEFSFL